MFEGYREIFDQRGAHYHQAMRQCPLARARELRAMVERAQLAPGQLVLDMPSGGGYLGDSIDVPVRLLCVDTAADFVRSVEPAPGRAAMFCHDLACTLLPDGCADRVISLAGVHHLEDKHAFYREALRLLRPQGLFCLADVATGSAQDGFLNGFVDAHSSMGHKGRFLDVQVGDELRHCGFELERQEDVAYTWDFSSRAQMAAYCRLLFGIDRASDAQIIDGIAGTVGVNASEGDCRMNWGLRFACCRRP